MGLHQIGAKDYSSMFTTGYLLNYAVITRSLFTSGTLIKVLQVVNKVIIYLAQLIASNPSACKRGEKQSDSLSLHGQTYTSQQELSQE